MDKEATDELAEHFVLLLYELVEVNTNDSYHPPSRC